MKKCINLANSTFNPYVLYIELAQNTKQFRRLILENFITVINFLFGSTYTGKSFCWHTWGNGILKNVF